ncbi:MAG: sorbosone dehydrogenase family protein [Gammaproteobacteria bacterium]|nr:sorbosone dehydrogenase family protein [Gammaproteobacteria bacterium]
MRKLLVVLVLLAIVFAVLNYHPEPAPVSTGFGTQPELPEPETGLIPTVHVAEATGWPEGQTPLTANGLEVIEFAQGLDHPRWIHVLPNGDVLVAESNSPNALSGIKGIKGFVAKRIMKKAGAAVPSADRITLLRDADNDGVAETQSVFLEKLYSPFGMTLIGNTLYIANADGIVSVPYQSGDLKASSQPQEFFTLPSGINHHWTKNIVASKDGSKLYATVGSNSNIGENGMDIEVGRAAIWEIDVATAKGTVIASGLRNPVGMDFGPSGELFTVVNERDELGDNLVPDYLTSVKQDGFYGWPYSYFGQIVDERVQPQKPELVAKAIVPDYALGAHTASLGLAITNGTQAGIQSVFGSGAFIGQHGSWNRKPRSGYKVIFVPFVNGMPNGEPRDVLSGFLDGDTARGRPVGVNFDDKGGLLVADDVGNNIWLVRTKN